MGLDLAGLRNCDGTEDERLAHHRLKMEGSTLSAIIDGTTVGSATDATYTSGLAGLGVTGFQTEQFDKLVLTPGTDRPPAFRAGTATAPTPRSGHCHDRPNSQKCR